MSFGLCGAAQSFQRFVDSVLRNLTVQTNEGERKVSFFAYIDDILIASKNEHEHIEDLHALFTRLQEYGLHINLKKCSFLQPQLEFLGHNINTSGISLLSSKVQAIRDFHKPVTLKDLRRYMGMINFYHSFIQNAAELLAPLTALLSTARCKSTNKKIIWNDLADAAFIKSKTLLSEATLLHHPVHSAETSVAVDASNIAIAGVLQQRVDGSWKPISFFSKKLTLPQQKYSTFSRELLAIFSSIKHFRHYIEGSKFHVLTDHQPILKALNKKSSRDLPREERWLDFISIFTTDIRHIKGSHNIVADAVSRHLDNVNTTDDDGDNIPQTSDIASLFVESDLDNLKYEQSKSMYSFLIQNR